MSNPPSPDALRSALAVAERSGVGRAYPIALRRAAAAHGISARDRGAPLTVVAAALGLPPITLQRWIQREGASMFRSAVVVEPAAPPSSPLVVHGPRGLRVEGLDVAGVAELLRRLA